LISPGLNDSPDIEGHEVKLVRNLISANQISASIDSFKFDFKIDAIRKTDQPSPRAADAMLRTVKAGYF